MIDRRARIHFEDVADLYAETRLPYPEELVEDVVALSGIPEGGRILEIGAGSGNATAAFARRGYRILAIELGERLAGFARRRCRDHPAVEVRTMAFEDWVPEEKAFDLALSADAFHWIEPAVGYPNVARALKDGCSFACWHNVPVDPGTDWSRAVDALEAQVLPPPDETRVPFTAEWLVGIIRDAFARSGRFEEPAWREYAWSVTQTADQYVKLARTYSGHWSLDPATRERLYAGMGEIIEKAGGSIVRPLKVVLFLAKVKR